MNALTNPGASELHPVRRVAVGEAPLRLAIIGCGAISESAHIPATVQVREVQLVGLVDTDVAHARTLASRFGIERAESRLEDLADDVDAVVLATPPHIRSSLAQQALELGLHVLCEKPMASNSAECQMMLSAASAAARILAVGHNYRFFPNRAYAQNLYKNGQLGRMVAVNIEQGDRFGSSSRTLYTLRREMVPGGVLFNDGIHTLDMLLAWFGEPDTFEYRDDSLGGLESNTELALNYSDGGAAHFRLSRTCSLSNSVTMRFEYGELSFPIYDMSGLSLRLNGRSGKLVLHTTPWDFVEVAALQLRDFALAALNGVSPSVPGEDGFRTVRFIEACYLLASRRPRPSKTPLPGVPW